MNRDDTTHATHLQRHILNIISYLFYLRDLLLISFYFATPLPQTSGLPRRRALKVSPPLGGIDNSSACYFGNPGVDMPGRRLGPQTRPTCPLVGILFRSLALEFLRFYFEGEIGPVPNYPLLPNYWLSCSQTLKSRVEGDTFDERSLLLDLA